MKRLLIILTILVNCAFSSEYKATVGENILIKEVEIAKPQVEVIPRKSYHVPIILRISNIKETADSFLYDIHVESLEPGEYDLRKYLKKINGATLNDADPIKLQVSSLLPKDQIEPQKPSRQTPERIDGYITTLKVIAALWILGLIILIFKRKKNPESESQTIQKPSLKKRMSKLIKEASEGTINNQGRAKLERMIIEHWRNKIPETKKLSPSQALKTLRKNPQSSPLIIALEKWIHSPEPISKKEIDELLKEYTNKENK